MQYLRSVIVTMLMDRISLIISYYLFVCPPDVLHFDLRLAENFPSWLHDFRASTEYSSSCLFICLLLFFFSLMAYLNLN